MKILRLDLRHVGPFADAAIALADAGEGRMTVVHGENEAGKSTTLAAIRRLLFGHVDRLAHGVDPSEVSVGALLELSNGALVEVSRRRGGGEDKKSPRVRGKGKASPAAPKAPRRAAERLVGRALAGGDEYDEGWLMQRLGHPNQEVFESVFAFSLDDLARGADALSGEEVRSVVYGAGLGGVSPQAVLEALREEKNALFGQGAAKRPINVSAGRIFEAEQRAAHASMPSETLKDLERDAQRKKAAATARYAARDALAKERERTSALLAGVEPYRDLAAAEAELAEIDAPQGLGADAEPRYRTLVEAAARTAREIEETRGAIEELDRVLSTPLEDEGLAASADEIRALYRELEAYARARKELPERVSELALLLRTTEAQLGEVRPGWDLAKLRATQMDHAARADLEAAAAAHDATVTATRHAEAEVVRLRARVEDASRRLHALPKAPDASAARAWLEGFSGFVALEEQLRLETARRDDLARQRDAVRARLSPPYPVDGPDPTSLPLPPLEEVRACEAELARAEAKLARVEEQIVEVEAAIAHQDDGLAALSKAGHAPSEDELAHARQRRDAGLRLLFRALAGELADEDARAYDGERSLPRAYEKSVEEADRTVDAMRARADAVHQRAHLEAERARAERRRGQLVEDRARLVAACESVHERHRALYAASGFVPLSPHAMSAWLGTHRAYVDLGLELARAERTVQDRERARDAFALAGGEALGQKEAPIALRAEAERRVEAEKLASARAVEAERDARREQAALEEAEQRLARLHADAATWKESWERALVAIGLETTLSVPAARLLVEALKTLRDGLVLREGPLAARRDDLTRDVTRFEARARALAPDARDPADAVEDLHVRLGAAEAARARRASQAEAREEARRRLTRLESERAQHETEIRAFRETARATDDAEVYASTRLAKRAAELRGAVDEHTRTLLRLRGPWEREAYFAALATATPEILRAELDRTGEALTEIEREARALDGEATLAERARSEVDGSAAAAEALAEVTSERAALRDLVERYAVLAVAGEILERSIERFETERQPELLREASRFFEEMTAGRYRAIGQRLDGDLFVERASGKKLAPDELSTGTREQLFLAIRLAFVEHYAKGAEPLPVVLDDVLVNFDAARAGATLRALASFAKRNQVLFFTCHEHLVELATRAGARHVELGAAARGETVSRAEARGRGT